jgi:hypothetical protein
MTVLVWWCVGMLIGRCVDVLTLHCCVDDIVLMSWLSCVDTVYVTSPILTSTQCIDTDQHTNPWVHQQNDQHQKTSSSTQQHTILLNWYVDVLMMCNVSMLCAEVGVLVCVITWVDELNVFTPTRIPAHQQVNTSTYQEPESDCYTVHIERPSNVSGNGSQHSVWCVSLAFLL